MDREQEHVADLEAASRELKELAGDLEDRMKLNMYKSEAECTDATTNQMEELVNKGLEATGKKSWKQYDQM